MKPLKKSDLIITFFIILIFGIIGWVFLQTPSSSTPISSQTSDTFVSKELDFAVNRVIRYWKEKEPNSEPDKAEITETIRNLAAYRKISYDRAADLIILTFKTGDPDIIEFMR